MGLSNLKHLIDSNNKSNVCGVHIESKPPFGLVRRPVESDKPQYNKIQCDAGHVKYIHEDY